jgi:hypothetical protein
LTKIAMSDDGGMMKQAQAYLGKQLQSIKVLDIQAGANIRQIRPDGVDKLFDKIKATGLLPVRD